ncbi:MAG: flavodoxin-dependent (E)-4-hydroxy-3-methylbut-2-enyl-diphosphate synthase [Ruminococcus sp.]|nr:flavodoxin-dependent (E)-4-hydroxy-3-methylbut-2-enyl-diphosphate synthase [Ruminococcus sp.]
MRNVKPVSVGNCVLDGKHILIQSMLNTHYDDIEGGVAQALALEREGCEIIRVAIPNREAIAVIPAIREKVSVPLVADIHFDYRLALEAVDAGIDKIRINPGNIGDRDRVHAVVRACQAKQIPIRIGVNSGSLEKEILEKNGAPTPEALVESAMGQVRLLESFDFDNIVISMKSSDVSTMIDAYRLCAQQCSYPLHLGVTEAGTERMGLIKSAIGIGALLHDGIGETIRVSLTEDPIREVKAAKDILKCIGKRGGPQVISCPTCGRTCIDLVKVAKEVEAALEDFDQDIKVAVMGCVVNGPGEAREADIGIAGGDGCAVLFRKGEMIRRIAEEDIVPELLTEIKKL